jgi:hypothetical protein
MSENTVRASPNAGKKHKTSFIIAAVAAVFMTITGALGTDAAPVSTRFLFWIVVMESGALIAMGVEVAISTWGRLKHWPWVESAAVAFGIALPLTLVVAAMRSILFELPMIPAKALIEMFGYVFFVSLIMTSLSVLMGHVHIKSSSSQAAPEPLPVPDPATAPAHSPTLSPVDIVPDTRFRDRLPPHLQEATLYAVQSEDHYLRVHTDRGEAMILHRLSDAITELSAIEGRQVHRSWWVAKAAIQSVRKADSKIEFILTNDLTVPVSRTTAPALRKAGWIK